MESQPASLKCLPRSNRRGLLVARDTGIRMFTALAIAVGILAVSTSPGDRPAFGAETPCADGVVVVVDFTDLGGKAEARCAEADPETGRAALDAAGFTLTESQPGLICAINSLPDPCPETFQGSFWSYWHSTAGDDWTSYQVGADSSDPAPGDIEGWRYNDGGNPPGIAPANAAAALPAPTPTVPSDPDAVDGQVSVEQEGGAGNTVTSVAALLGIVAVLTAIGVIMASARRRSAGTGD